MNKPGVGAGVGVAVAASDRSYRIVQLNDHMLSQIPNRFIVIINKH